MRQIFILVLLSFLSFNVTYTQSLEKLIQIAQSQNLDLKILEKEYLAALERAPQVSQLSDPELGIGTFLLPVETRLGAQTARVSATQMFPWLGTLESKENLELAKAKALYERIGVSALNLIYQVEQSYFKLYEIQERQQIMERSLFLFERLEQLALAKVESGKTTAADVLRVQLKSEELKQELLLLEQEKVQPRSTLNQLLNRDLNMAISTVDTLEFANLIYDKSALINNISANHPMLKMYALQQEVAQKSIELNELSGKPSFGVGADYIFVNERTDATFLDNGRDALQLRASIKIPLYRQKYKAREREEQLKIQALDDQKTNTLNQFVASIESAFADYKSAQLRLELYQKQKEIIHAAINILETNYSSSGSGFDELLRLEQDLILYDLKELEVIVESHLIKSLIDRYVDF